MSRRLRAILQTPRKPAPAAPATKSGMSSGSSGARAATARPTAADPLSADVTSPNFCAPALNECGSVSLRRRGGVLFDRFMMASRLHYLRPKIYADDDQSQ